MTDPDLTETEAPPHRRILTIEGTPVIVHGDHRLTRDDRDLLAAVILHLKAEDALPDPLEGGLS